MSVASETGKALADDAKTKLQELIDTVDEENGLKKLEKLTYFMNDHTTNEKKSNKMLKKWRDGIFERTQGGGCSSCSTPIL